MVLYVSANGVNAGPCSAASPCSLGTALATSKTSNREYTKVLPGDYSAGDFGFTIDANLIVHAAGATFTAGDTAPYVFSLTNVFVEIEGAKFTRGQNAGTLPAITVDGGSLNLDGVTFDVPATAIVDNSSGTFKHSHFIAHSAAGGLLSVGKTGRIIDSCLFEGGPSWTLGLQAAITAVNSIFVNSPTSLGSSNCNVSFSTFYNSPVTCSKGTAPTATNLLTNSVLFSNGTADVYTGNGCLVSYSLLRPQAVAPSADHILSMDPKFKSAADGDFHLLDGSPAIDSANPAASLSLDFDGHLRPIGSARDMGALERQ